MSAGVVLLAACDDVAAPLTREGPSAGRAAAGAPAARSHSQESDLSGDYRPTDGRVGDLVVRSLFIGQTEAFAAFEAGAGASPVTIEVSGADGRIRRIAAHGYAVNDDRIRFSGEIDGAPVRFDGRIDAGALATSRRNLGGDSAVIVGALTVGAAAAPMRFAWYGGD